MPKRDPRKDPKAGDELEKANKRWTTYRLVDDCMNGAVRYWDGLDDRELIADCLLTSWRKWAKKAQVIHAAD